MTRIFSHLLCFSSEISFRTSSPFYAEWQFLFLSRAVVFQGFLFGVVHFYFFIGYERNYATLFWTGKTKQALEYTSSKKVEETFNDFGNMLPTFRCLNGKLVMSLVCIICYNFPLNCFPLLIRRGKELANKQRTPVGYWFW